LRGGTPTAGVLMVPGVGLSPLARGNPYTPPKAPPAPGSIPACAGEPMRSVMLPPHIRVYPRLRGGTFCKFSGFLK